MTRAWGSSQPRCSCKEEASGINTPTSLSSHPLSPVGDPHWTNPSRSRRGRESSDVVGGANFLDIKKGDGDSRGAHGRDPAEHYHYCGKAHDV